MEGHEHMHESHAAPHAGLSGMLHAHDVHSRHAHHTTHEKLDDVEDEVEELRDDVEEAIHRGRESCHTSHSGVHKVYDTLAGGSGLSALIGGAVGGFGGGLFSSFFDRGFRGGWGGGHDGGGCGCGGKGCSCCCEIQGAETRIEDRIDSASSTQQHFDSMMMLGGLKAEVAAVGWNITNQLQRSFFEAQIANDRNAAVNLAAVKEAQYQAVRATEQAQFALALQASDIAYKQLQFCCDRDRCDSDRRHSEAQITIVRNEANALAVQNQNQQQQQMQLLDERNNRRHEILGLHINALGNYMQNGFQQATNVTKSVNFGSGSAATTNTPTQNIA